MGLEEFKIAPDNKGGRPEKTEEDEKRIPDGDPFTGDKDTEEYWSNIHIEFCNFGDINSSRVASMADFTHTSPWTVVNKLEEYGLIEPGDYETPDDYPVEVETTSSSTIFSSNMDEDSGLASILQDAK